MDVVCLGEALIDFVALETGVEVGDASGFVKAPGGAPANVAVGVVRLGGSSAFIGKVGDDPFGRFLTATFAGAGVDVRGVRFDPDVRTGLAFVSLAAGGERDFCFFRNPSADMMLRPDELDAEMLRDARALHVGSITLIQDPSRVATYAAAAIAREAGRIVSYDPNLRPPLWPDLEHARREILAFIPQTDVLKVSEEEAAFLTGRDSPADAAAGMAHEFRNLRLIAVTRGATGCLWYSREAGPGEASGFRVPSVDTTGAGDGFVAAMLLGLLSQTESADSIGRLDREALSAIFRRANAVGALTTTRKGAIPALPTSEQVTTMMEDVRP